jgi:hypothetical protein
MAGKTPYPLPGALLPLSSHYRFTNLYSKKNGVLGEYPRAEMISKEAEVNKWQKADSSLIAPCFYIAVTAQGALRDNMHRMRMPLNKLTLLSWAANKSTRFLRHTSRTVR